MRVYLGNQFNLVLSRKQKFIQRVNGRKMVGVKNFTAKTNTAFAEVDAMLADKLGSLRPEHSEILSIIWFLL
jgi:hypothetical protein